MLPIPKFYKSITGIDIAFVDGGAGADTITQVAAQFVIAGFVAGDVITISGSTSNDGDYTIVSLVAGTITLATGVLTAEIAGDTVTVETEASGTYDFGSCDAGGYKPDTTGLEIHLWNDKDNEGSDDMTSIRLIVRDSDGNEVELWTTNRWVEVKSNGVGGTAVDDAMTTFARVGKDHPLWLGDIPKASYRVLYVRLHSPVSAQEGNIAWQLIVLYQDGETESTEIFVLVPLHYQDVRAEDEDYIHAAITGTGGELEVTTAITNPDVPRNISIKTTNVATPSGDVEITGINSVGEADSETITITPGGTAYGSKAFMIVTKITLPATVSGSDTVTVGISDKIGLNHSIINTTDVIKKTVNNKKRY